MKTFRLNLPFSTFLLFVLFAFAPVFAQPSELTKKPDNYNFYYNFFQKVFDAQTGDKDENNNWAKRWLWNSRREINPDGSFIIYSPNEMEKSFNSDSKNYDNMLSQNGWVPVGPLTVPPTYEPRSCYSLGRINCVAFHPLNPEIFYIGTPGGGVWKTINGGKSWTPLCDNLPSLAVSSIAVDQTNPETIYFAAGDFDISGMTARNALGVYKSTDAGATWNLTDLWKEPKFQNSILRKILINPINSNEIIAAGRRGLWKSADAGTTWRFVCDSNFTDIEMDEHNHNTLFAGTGTVSNYYGSAGVMKSTDFGESWQMLNTGIEPKNKVSRVDVAVSPADGNYIYALTVWSDPADYSRYGGFSGFYRSTDGGKTWTLTADCLSKPNMLGAYNGDSLDKSGQGTYDLVLLADPTDKNKIYTGGINVWSSEDGGSNWNIVSHWIYVFGKSTHADQHFAAYNHAGKDFYWCNDGGIYRTKQILQGSLSWIDWLDRYEENSKPGTPDYKFPTEWENLTDGMNITEFYRIGLCRSTPDVATGGSQDNSCYYYNTGNWVNYIANYDGMETMVDHYNPMKIYGVWQGGGLCRSFDGGKTITKRLADTIMGKGERGNWITPVAMDPVNSDKIYIGFRNLWQSYDNGNHWRKILDFDPASNDSSNRNSLTIIKTSYSDSNFISVFKESAWVYPAESKVWKKIPGELWVTTDGGVNWNLRNTGLPVDSMVIESIEYDSHNPRKMWVAFSSSYPNVNLSLTTDGGETWSDVSRTMPYSISINAIVHQPNSLANIIYAGTNRGVFYTDDSMKTWLPFGTNLPNAIINDLEIQNISNELYAASYGRGFWKTNLLPDGVNEIAEKGTVSIFPNPNSGNFSVKLGQDANPVDLNKFEVTDVTGKTVFTGKLNGYTTEIKTGLQPGAYFIQLKVNSKSYSGKIVITK